ncbi:MAG TPA: carbamoyltransferase HypF [Bryobacteraceae bacterium]
MTIARAVRVRGMVQGVGFRPFVFRLARANSLAGWVLNEPHGVDIHLEGAEPALDAFLHDLETQAPPAARITAVEVGPTEQAGLRDFTIRESKSAGRPSVRISPDLPICEDCLSELFDPANPRYSYPYINCTNCGPRYSVIESLPYDRAHTTMKHWPMDAVCAVPYGDPSDRRFHAQPIACPACGPHYRLEPAATPAIEKTAELLRAGHIVAIKGIGGYHLACDANNEAAVSALRERKYRKEKPFAVMVRTIEIARRLADVSPESEALLTSLARPIVLAPAKVELPGVAPGNSELGLLLPYAPLQHLLFAAGAPEALVMTSANRSSEPIAYEDDDACRQLSGIADAFLIGERPIARRVDDSVARAGVFGPVILRRSRGYAPGAVARLPYSSPLLAVGADLKNTITLVVDGQAFVSQHIGDLDHFASLQSFRQTIRDLVSMYEVSWDNLLVVHDSHPQYASTTHARELPSPEKRIVQHHRAHIASVLAEREAWEERVVGVSFDGTGYGDDGSIWGGEFFAGSMAEGFRRVMHLRPAILPGGDASARHPVQCAAGFLSQIDGLPPLTFPRRYQDSLQLIAKQIRTFETTSMGRLFDAAAALLGFTREISFEGQAAMWLEHLARTGAASDSYPFPIDGDTLDFRPLLSAVAHDRLRGRETAGIARAFHRGVAHGLCAAVKMLCESHGTRTSVLSGGVFQNEMLLHDAKTILEPEGVRIWTNACVPPNDGGISLGQAALAALGHSGVFHA